MKQLLINDIQTMIAAQGYWQSNRTELAACFQISLTKAPNDYAIFCGINSFSEKISDGINSEELSLLASLTDNSGQALFASKFLNYLDKLQFTCSLQCVNEGTPIFINEPVIAISGPLLQCHLLSSILLTTIRNESGITTNSSAYRNQLANQFLIYKNSKESLPYARAAYLAGINQTTNILAHNAFNIPLCNLMPENWVTSFTNEADAFRNIANSMPGETILAIDTFNPLSGCENAINIGKELRRRKHDLFAVQLKAENLNKYAKRVRKQLDNAGFTNTKIISSVINSPTDITENKTTYIDGWSIAESLINNLQTLEFSCNIVSINNFDDIQSQQNMQQIRRFYSHDIPVADIIYHNTIDLNKHKKFNKLSSNDLLQPIYHEGELIHQFPTLNETLDYTKNQLDHLKQINFAKYKIYQQGRS